QEARQDRHQVDRGRPRRGLVPALGSLLVPQDRRAGDLLLRALAAARQPRLSHLARHDRQAGLRQDGATRAPGLRHRMAARKRRRTPAQAARVVLLVALNAAAAWWLVRAWREHADAADDAPSEVAQAPQAPQAPAVDSAQRPQLERELRA